MRDATGTAARAWGVPVPPLGNRSAVVVTPLAAFADEADALAATTSDARFRGSDRYADMDALRRRLRDMADRMRRAASITPNARPIAMMFGRTMSGGREVAVVRARRRTGMR